MALVLGSLLPVFFFFCQLAFFFETLAIGIAKQNMLVNLPRGVKPLFLLITFALIWIVFWSKLSAFEREEDSSLKNDPQQEKLSIEDAFNFIDLQPLPSDADLSSNQSVVDIIAFAKYAFTNMRIPRSFYGTVKSILKYTSAPIHVHVLTDAASFIRIRRLFRKLRKEVRTPPKYSLYNLDELEPTQSEVTDLLRRFFFTKFIEKYKDDIFFLTPAFHRMFPNLQRAIFLDTDLQFRADIVDLWAKFAEFNKDHIIGISHDLQPHYRHEFALYRKKHNDTDIGNARPGKQGFNTGVMLMDFDRMRNSKIYNELLLKKNIKKLVDKYEFYGYLGHQDFFTLIGVEYPELFYLLDCTWNRQIDTSWNSVYKGALYEAYHRCEGTIRVYHANGGHPLPPDLL